MHFRSHALRSIFVICVTGTTCLAQVPSAAFGPSSHVAAAYSASEAISSTGIKPLNIPVYTINSGSLSHEITLYYEGIGNRVEEEASWVGLGFSLNVGGSIVRSVRGLPDEKTDGWLSSPTQSTIAASQTLLDKANTNQLDTNPDIFSFSFDGHEGKMIFDKSGQVHFMPHRNLEVDKDAGLSYFIVTTENGTKYTFNRTETSTVESNKLDHPSIANEFNSAWLLTSITAADGTSSITFDYTTAALSHTGPMTGDETVYKVYRTNYAGVWTEEQEVERFDFEVHYRTPILQRINFKNGYITFEQGGRLDSDFPSLKKMNIFYTDDSPFKSYVFDYDYFIYQSTALSGPSTVIRRLRLNRFWEAGQTIAKNPYTFEYFTQTKKVDNSMLAKSRDYWGFFNGVTKNSIIPPAVEFDQSNPDIYVSMEGKSAMPDLESTKSFVLSAVRYPNGGKTTFEYELNTAQFDWPQDPVLQSSTISISNTSTTRNFTVPSNSGFDYRGVIVKFRITSACGSLEGAPPCQLGVPSFSDCPFITITGGPPGNNKSWSCNYNNEEYEFRLPPGDYTLKGLQASGRSRTFKAELFYWYLDPLAMVVSKPVGGLRVVRIKTYENETDPKPMVKRYSYNGDNGETTGYLYNPVLANSKDGTRFVVFKELPGSPCQPVGDGSNGRIWTGLAVSSYPLTLQSEQTVGYQRITEFDGENGENGKKEYHFYKTVYQPEYGTNNIMEVATWARGKLEREITFRKSGGNFLKVSERHFVYTTFEKHNVVGFTVGKVTSSGAPCNGIGWQPEFTIYEYHLSSSWVYLNQIEVTEYDTQGNSRIFVTRQEYDDVSLMKTKEIQDTSIPNEKLVTIANYPDNYQDVNLPNNFISSMKSGHMISIPIEVVKYIERTPTSGPVVKDIISSTITTYKPGNNILPDWRGRVNAIYKLKLPNGVPIAWSSFQFANASAPGADPLRTNLFSLPSSLYMTEYSVGQYDNEPVSGKINRSLDDAGAYTCHRYGYNGAFAIARASNSDQLKFSSFEDQFDPGWGWSTPGTTVTSQLAKTGKKYYDLTGSDKIECYDLDPDKTYRVSFWSKESFPVFSATTTGGNGETGYVDGVNWKFYSRLISGVTFLRLTAPAGQHAYLDELLLAEDGATVETSTYDTLKGRTSRGDGNGKLEITTYDELGRIQTVIDERGQVIKTFKYGEASLN